MDKVCYICKQKATLVGQRGYYLCLSLVCHKELAIILNQPRVDE